MANMQVVLRRGKSVIEPERGGKESNVSERGRNGCLAKTDSCFPAQRSKRSVRKKKNIGHKREKMRFRSRHELKTLAIFSGKKKEIGFSVPSLSCVRKSTRSKARENGLRN